MLEKFIDNAREDSLTAAVFSHLRHLPSQLFWRILSKACCCAENLPDCPGEPDIFNPWPKWNPTGTVTNNTYVEPDVFIRFAAFDLIIEAKIAKAGTQSGDQWQNELIAYTNEYGKDKRSVRMIALGGIHSEGDVTLTHTWRESATESGSVSGNSHQFNCPVHMCQWSTVLLECQRLKRELEEANMNNPSFQTFAHIRILNDLRLFFEVHGYPALKWFDDFKFESNLLDDSVGSDQQYFRNISLNFQSLL
jgi:hypothetical protein